MSSAGVADTQPTLETIKLASQDNLTAKVGGGQSQNPLNAAISLHRITVVASANDSMTMFPAKAGMVYVLTNAAAANSMNVFPSKGEVINALGVNAAFAMAAGKVAIFICVTDGQWHSILGA
jgi:hypothetical protein